MESPIFFLLLGIQTSTGPSRVSSCESEWNRFELVYLGEVGFRFVDLGEIISGSTEVESRVVISDEVSFDLNI